MRVQLWSLIGGLLLGSAPIYAQAPHSPCVVSISLEEPAVRIGNDTYTVKAGSKLFVKVELTNTSKNDLVIGDGYDARFGADTYYNHYEVRDGNGNLVPQQPISHPELGRTSHGWPRRTVKPRQTMSVNDDLVTRLYDLSKPGKYTIQDLRAVSDKTNEGRVKSNAITLLVTE